jgi:hypothetical protein
MTGQQPYRWAWGQKPGYDRGTMPRVFDRDRKGERCAVLARGKMNSALIEFEDGYRVITSRNGLRRIKEKDVEPVRSPGR